ncbi:MAG: peptide MFS transporter [Bacteroidota bacterium]
MDDKPHKQSQELLGQPKGLYVLYFTEMWERLSFYGMKSILIYFLTAKVLEGGWGMEKGTANIISGLYSFLAYFMCIPSGPLADRYLGPKKTVMWGAALQFIGHLLLGITAQKIWFVSGIWFLAIGTGLLKTNISTMVGALYQDRDQRRERGFSIFYQGINVGSLIGSLIVPFIKDRFGFHAGFMVAGVGMFLSLLIFVLGVGYLAPERKRSAQQQSMWMSIPALVVAGLALLFIVNHYISSSKIPALLEVGNRVLIVLLSISLLLLCLWVFFQAANKKERGHIMVVFLAYLGVMSYVVIYMQCEGLFMNFAKESVNRIISIFGKEYEIGAAYFYVLNPILIILFSYPVTLFWKKVNDRYTNLAATTKMGVGLLLFAVCALIVSYAIQLSKVGLISPLWVVVINLLIVLGEICIMIPGLSLVSSLAPQHLKSTVMGTLWGFISLGSAVGGEVGNLAEKAISSGGNNVFSLLLVIFGALGCFYLALNNLANQKVNN